MFVVYININYVYVNKKIYTYKKLYFDNIIK